MTAATRRLGPGDEAEVEAFLVRFPDTTLFLRSNMRRVGLGWSGRDREGHWVARVDAAGAIAGVACHAWNGMVLIEDAQPDLAARAAVAASGRAISGLVGPPAQVADARAALGLADVPAALDDDEVLMTLDLAALRVPAALASGAVACRRAREADLDVMADWRHDYSVEALHMTASDELRASARAQVEGGIAHGTMWVLEDAGGGGALVAMTGFNATMPDVVQIGGVWTPPALRRRGFAQAVVAGSLLEARAGGVTRAVLFADRANPSSTTAYRRIGFADAGGYALIMFATPMTPRPPAGA